MSFVDLFPKRSAAPGRCISESPRRSRRPREPKMSIESISHKLRGENSFKSDLPRFRCLMTTRTPSRSDSSAPMLSIQHHHLLNLLMLSSVVPYFVSCLKIAFFGRKERKMFVKRAPQARLPSARATIVIKSIKG